MRKRLITKDQTNFSQELYKVGEENYFSDLDAVQYIDPENEVFHLVDTENEVFTHYRYVNNTSVIRRIIEIKYKPTEYLRNLIKGSEKPNPQIQMFSNMVTELNSCRCISDRPPLQFYFLIQSEGKYPYFAYDVTNEEGSIKYNYLSQIKDEDQLKNLLRA